MYLLQRNIIKVDIWITVHARYSQTQVILGTVYPLHERCEVLISLTKVSIMKSPAKALSIISLNHFHTRLNGRLLSETLLPPIDRIFFI
jgi:hypothetical protein